MDCVFCKIVKKEIKADIIYEDDRVVAFSDIKPRAPVHVLIIPREHKETLDDMYAHTNDLMGAMFTAVRRIASEKKVDRSGYRVVINCGRDAGQEVSHLHVHLLGGRAMAWPPG
ncbi:MAG: histidine triad nucleotide-binding protein [Candidatus Omnitrophica bacterium]|nr:histidine triad nucleotide-binding protein [Candidatus Omnitrophota bacterium]